MFRRVSLPLATLSLVATVSAAPQPPVHQTQPQQTYTVWTPHTIPTEPIDAAAIAKIRSEGMDRSKIMWIEHYLTDVYGPRPTGSPNHVVAANGAVKTMTGWGLKNAHLEPFTWRGGGGRGNAPSAESRIFAAERNRPLNVPAPGLIPPAPPTAEATAPQADRNTSLQNAPGKLVLNADGSFVYTPAKDFTGTDTFTYALSGVPGLTGGTATIVGK